MTSDKGISAKTLTLILAVGEGKTLYPLTRTRPQPLVSYGGMFRIIDFTLSNCWNSGIRRAFVLTDYQHWLTERYLDSLGWNGNLTGVFPDSGTRYKGTAGAVFQSIGLLQLDKPDYVLILEADHVYKMDYRKLLEFHVAHGADVTTAGSPRIGAYVFNVSILRRALLIDALSTGEHDFRSDVIPRLVQCRHVHDDDCISQWCADSVDSYYWSQIELLLRNSSFDLYTDDSWPIFGAELERPISLLRDKSKGTSSIISTNARVHGADISHCIISQNVDIAPGTRVESSILFKSVRVGQGARIRKAIIDENVRIPDRAIIGYDPETDRQHFVVTKTGVVVVDRDAIHRFNATRKATAGKSVAA